MDSKDHDTARLNCPLCNQSIVNTSDVSEGIVRSLIPTRGMPAILHELSHDLPVLKHRLSRLRRQAPRAGDAEQLLADCERTVEQISRVVGLLRQCSHYARQNEELIGRGDEIRQIYESFQFWFGFKIEAKCEDINWSRCKWSGVITLL